MKKRKIVVANLKMNLISLKERENYIKRLNNEIENNSFESELIICPQVLHLENFLSDVKSKDGVSIGGQDMFWKDKGSFTGEISPAMLSDIGISYNIIGHSERRNYFGETDEIVNLKIKSALRNKIDPIFCIGESKEERKSGKTQESISKQILEGLSGISRVDLLKIIFAYEPIWSVGSNLIPSSNEVMEVKILIKKVLSEKFGEKYADQVRVLYGGSVKYDTVGQVCIEPEMDGVLVGRESLIPYDLFKIIKEIGNND